jgi:hypothetical protein
VDTREPDAAAQQQFADVLGYVESRCAHPYEALARLRAARIAILGAGPVVDAVTSELASYGISAVRPVPVGTREAKAMAAGVIEGDLVPDVLVAVDDVDHRRDLVLAAIAMPTDQPLVPVLAGPSLAVVGPALTGPAQAAAFLVSADRFGGWREAEEVPAAPRPVSATVAGAFAARVVLDRLLGLPVEPVATLVHGRTLECEQVPLALPVLVSDEPPWRELTAADDVPEAGASGTADTAGETGPVDSGAVTARWTGFARRGADLDLPQLPVALATVREVPARDVVASESASLDAISAAPAVLGWGSDPAGAGVDALLSLLRTRAAEQLPGQAGWMAAAGTSGRRFVVDGLLRLVTRAALSTPAEELRVGAVTTWIGRSLWNLVTDYYELPIRLWQRQVPGLRWPLISITDAAGTPLTHQWGPDQQDGLYAALAAVVARCQLTEDPATTADLDLVGGWAVRTASAAELDEIHAELTELAAANGQRVTGLLLTADPVIGKLPLYGGLVGLR